MRIRGRRVVLLIAGALPLLAVDDQHDVSMGPQRHDDNGQSIQDDVTRIQPQHSSHDSDHNQGRSAIYSSSASTPDAGVDGMQLPSLPPLNLLQVEADLFLDGNSDESSLEGFARGVSKLEQHVSVVVKEDKDNHADDSDDDAEKEDNNEDKGTSDKIDASSRATYQNESDEEEEIIDSTEDGILDSKTDGLKESSESSPGIHDTVVVDTADAEEERDGLKTTANLESTNETELATMDSVALNSTNMNASSMNTTDDSESEAMNQTLVNKTNDETQQLLPQVDQAEDEDSDLSGRVAVDYASKSAGALVLEKSSGFKGTSNLLNGNRDKYAISPCNEKKFVVLSLSEDIYVKQVKIANYELYSSRVKDIKIQISQTMGNWIDLGTYTATPASGVQTIDLREPAWGRYLKFNFKSHYGDEFYCTLSQIMVHGSTMVQGFHEQFQEEFNEEEEGLGVANDQNKQNNNVESEENSFAPQGDTSTNSSKVGDVDGKGNPTSEVPKDDVGGDTIESKTAFASSDSEKVVQVDGTDESSADVATAGGDAGESSTENSNDAAVERQDSPMGDSNKIVEEGSVERAEKMSTETDGGSKPRPPAMFSRKDRNFSTALPAASVGVSSNPFSSIIGRLEPLHLKSVHELHRIGESFPRPEQLNEILTKASDSTRAIKNALTDPAIFEHLQVWNEGSSLESPPNAFGSSEIGPREQTLYEKLTAYIDDSDNSLIKTGTLDVEKRPDTTQAETSEEAQEKTATENEAKAFQEQGTAKEMEDVPPGGTEQIRAEPTVAGSASFESLRGTDAALATLLDKIPSIECLKGLDFTNFKEKALAARKGGHGNSGHAASAQAAEPIFKMLTDQIKSLQSSLAIHDQFTKETVQCYQRVLLDVIVEMQTLRLDHEARLLKVEQDMQETKTIRWVFVLYQMLMGLPNWASLFIATVFTSFVSPMAISRPFEVVQSILGASLSRDEYLLLKWTVLTCVIILLVATTAAFCHRLMSTIKWPGRKRPKEIVKRAESEIIEDPVCQLTVKDAKGDTIITPATGSMSIRALPVVEPDPMESAEITPSASDLAEDRVCELNVEDAGGDIIITPAAEPQAINAVDAASEPDHLAARAASLSPVGVEMVPQGPSSVPTEGDPVPPALGSDAAPVSPSSVATPPACNVGEANK